MRGYLFSATCAATMSRMKSDGAGAEDSLFSRLIKMFRSVTKDLADVQSPANNARRMNSIETIICLILLLMAVPDLCRKLGRPALANVLFVAFGLALGPLVQPDVATMVKQAGE